MDLSSKLSKWNKTIKDKLEIAHIKSTNWIEKIAKQAEEKRLKE